jgi:hypothetical protein
MQIAHAHIFTPRPLFDGQNIMYTSKQPERESQVCPRCSAFTLPFIEQQFSVNMSDRPVAPGQQPKGVFMIKLTATALIDPS